MSASSVLIFCEVSLWGCNQPMFEVHISLQKVFEKEDKAKIEKCNHPTPEVLNSLQKVLKNEGDLRGFTMGTP